MKKNNRLSRAIVTGVAAAAMALSAPVASAAEPVAEDQPIQIQTFAIYEWMGCEKIKNVWCR